MLDLDRLEALIDQALNNETSLTMNEWLRDQRIDNLDSYLGIGNINATSIKGFSVQAKACNDQICWENSINNNPQNGLAIAA